MSRGKILIVEDEILSANSLKTILEDNDYEVVDICSRGNEAIKSALHHKPDVIIMDIILKGGMSGSEAALEISTNIDTKIIFLTAYYDEEAITFAVESKAQQYLIKPFNQEQILAAVKLALKESIYNESSNTIELNYGFSYNIEESKLYRNSVDTNLTNKENILIKELAKHINTPVTYKQLINAIYKTEAKKSALRTLISRLNNKLGVPLIENVNNIGYKLSAI